MNHGGPKLEMDRTSRRPSVVVPVVVGLAAVEMFMFAFLRGSGEVWGAALVAPGLVLLTVLILKELKNEQNDPRLAPFLLWALVLKLLGALVRYGVLIDAYDRAGDAQTYDRFGRQLASSYRAGVFDVDVGKIVGTNFIKIVTGFVYALVGSNEIAGFFVFSWLGFWGLYFFYRAFCLACPSGDRHRYALLLFFLPSMLFWPSSIGKEAWMMFSLGLAAYGAARLFTRAHGGFLLIGLGVLGTAMVRPHVTLMLVLALPVAYFVRRSPKRSTFGPLAKVAGSVVLVVLAVVVVGQAEKFLGVDTLDQKGVDQTIAEAGTRTDEGGSSFEAPAAKSPVQMPYAAISVLFRPFPHEAHNVQAIIASLEGVFLMGCFLLSWRRVVAVPAAMVRLPYVAMSCIYALLFIYAFSSFGNFGIITRERVQLFPFILIIFALPIRAGVVPRRQGPPPPVATRELVR